jgi:hypothetical protein
MSGHQTLLTDHVAYVKFKVLTAASMKTRVFWDVAPCNVVRVTDVSEVCTAATIRAMIMEAARTSETSVNFYDIARGNIQEDSY